MPACIIDDFGAGMRYSQDFHYSYPLNANGRVTVETFNGSVEVTGWDQNTIDISGTKYGPTQQAADDLRVNIDHSPDRAEIRVPRPSERRNNQGAKLVIKVPRAAVLDRITTSNGSVRTTDGVGPVRIRSSNGSIRVDHLRGSLDAQTSNSAVEATGIEGDVHVHTSNGHVIAKDFDGSFDAVTSNSSVTASVADPAGAVRVETSNGSVDLTLPAHYRADARVNTSNSSITVRMPAANGAHLVARTSNSSITTDFDLTNESGEITKRHVDAQIGPGGPLLDLSTSNGSIRVVKH